MPTSRHSELERKYDASEVSTMAFGWWCDRHHPIDMKTTAYPDHYYRRGSSVVRHRVSEGAGELTIKQRKSATDSTDRVEIDLTFGKKTTAEDVTAFIVATGWEHELTLLKNLSEVYWFKHGGAEVALSLYEVREEKSGLVRRMMEVEIEKGSDVDDETARRLLDIWCGVLTEDFHLGAPLADSLYEIYSGKRYEMDRSL